MLSLVACALLAVSPTIDPGALPPRLGPAPVAAAPAAQRPHLSLQLDVGFPAGAGAAMAFGPWRWLRLEVGAAHNGAAAGIRGGLTLSPFRNTVRPTLSAQAGHFPKGDIRPFARAVGAGDALDSSIFSSVQYDFLTAQLGVEMGAPSAISVFLRAGVSVAVARFLAFEDTLRDGTADPDLSARPLVLNLAVPSLQLGLSVPLL